MYPIKYYDIMRKCKDKKFIRYQMVNHAKEYGIKPAARAFNTNVKTVRKWLRRWKSGTMEGLEDQSRAPKNPLIRITKAQCNKVIELKKKMPSFGAKRLKRDYNLTLSDKAIRKIWKEEGLLKRKRKKHKTKNDLRAVKAAWKLCEQIDIDTKDLIDIPELWPQIQDNGLPKVQYTAREVVSGLHYVAYADERSLTYS
ncbi:MAG: helix-turn-helix domain-containing protein, partial [Deltaproteobacteria bacterium]|nr:helix-turn-helix domain-containing protein [Deltaproteobacteria bacterium]